MVLSYSQKFIFEHLPIKGSLVVLTDCWQTIKEQQAYPPHMSRLIGELMAANVMMTTNLKLTGKIICQVQNSPHFSLVVTECSNELNIRATAKFKSEQLSCLEYAELVSQGRLVVSIDSQAEGNLYQSIIAFAGQDLSHILNDYMHQSEQLKTWFVLAYTEDKIVGFMLQQLPDTQSAFTEEIERVFMLAKTVTETELQKDDICKLIGKLFAEDNVRILEPQAINFKCTCSYERVREILQSLGSDELQLLIEEQGNIMVDCDYCNAKYAFSADDLHQIALSVVCANNYPTSTQLN